MTITLRTLSPSMLVACPTNEPRRSRPVRGAFPRRLLQETLCAAALIGSAAACASTTDTTEASLERVASFIPMTAAPGQGAGFAALLIDAAPIVRATEPGTELWFALEAPEGRFAIFDLFEDAGARDAHFGGAVATAVRENAATLIAGGWDDGVVPNVRNADVLSIKEATDSPRATTATYIPLRAAAGRADELAAVLAAGGDIVARTEPGTLFWVALRLDEDDFAIFDTFADDAGRSAHFAGQVAALLEERSPELVDGGWQDGVVAGIRNFDVIATK